MKEKIQPYHIKLKEEIDGTFKKIILEEKSLNSSSQKNTSINSYVLSFNYWLGNYSSLATSRPLLKEALFKVSMKVEVSFFLAISGYNDDAIAKIRDAMDIFLHTLYYDVFWDSKSQDLPEPYKTKYAEWKYKDRDPVPLKKVVANIFTKKRLARYSKKYNLIIETYNLYSELSRYIHCRPNKGYKKKASASSTIINTQYVKEDFEKWVEYLVRFYNNISTISILYDKELMNVEEAKRFEKYEKKIYIQIKNLGV